MQSFVARALLGVAAALNLPDGRIDIGPYLQRAYDQGSQTLQLTSGVTYV